MVFTVSTSQPMVFATIATIVSIQGEFDWFYKACPKCNKKLKEHEIDQHVDAEIENQVHNDDRFFCARCNKEVENAQTRFNI